MDEYFDRIIFGCDLLEKDVEHALSILGWETEVMYPDESLARDYGFKLDQNGKVIDTSVLNDINVLIEGDKIIAINGIIATEKEYQKIASSREKLEITFSDNS